MASSDPRTRGDAPADLPGLDRAVQAVYKHFVHRAVRVFNEEGLVYPQLFGVVMDDALEQIRALLPIPAELMQRLHEDERGKAMLLPLVRSMLDPQGPAFQELKSRGLPGPTMAVQVSEVWMSQASAGKTPPSKDPARKEAILVTVHTREQSFAGVSPIEDTPVRHAVAGPLASEPVRGRMAVTGSSSPDTLH